MSDTEHHILIIDDDEEIGMIIAAILNGEGYRTTRVQTGEAGLKAFSQDPPDLVLCDLYMPGINGIETLTRLKARDASCKVVMMTASDSATLATQAMKGGAEDFLLKPITAQDLQGITARLLPDAEEAEDADGLEGVLTVSAAMRPIVDVARRVANTSATILITGDSGTGKEAVARGIHWLSDRSSNAFVTINCASIPPSLLEAELFGYEKGAFTDAKSRKAGLIETAEGGTLFLDEIGLMPPDLQGKILTVLETRRFRRVGGTSEIGSDARLIAATNSDLPQAVQRGDFREDLFYRLNVIPCHLPPLRDRAGDVPLLAEYFLREYCAQHAKPEMRLSEEAVSLLDAFHWPGNVRELKNVIERAVLLSENDTIQSSDLSIDRRQNPAAETNAVRVDEHGLIDIAIPDWGLSLEDVERQIIVAALAKTDGNVSRAAALLHLTRYTLRYRMKKHGIPLPGSSG